MGLGLKRKPEFREMEVKVGRDSSGKGSGVEGRWT